MYKISEYHPTTDCVSLSVADTGLVGGWPPHMLVGAALSATARTLPSTTLPPTLTTTTTASNVKKQRPGGGGGGGAGGGATPSSGGGEEGGATPPTPRLKRLNNAQQHNVYTLVDAGNGKTKFRCTACSRCFNLKCTLLRHVRHQHQGRFVPHPCGQCGQVFKRTDHLKVHMRKIHKMASTSRRSLNNSNSAASGNEGDGGSSPPTAQESAVAAVVASMASTQPLALNPVETEAGN